VLNFLFNCESLNCNLYASLKAIARTLLRHVLNSVGLCTVLPTDSPQLLGIIISPDWSFKQHISSVSARRFCQLRQMCSVDVRQQIHCHTHTCISC